jgi:hypothetical protein
MAVFPWEMLEQSMSVYHEWAVDTIFRIDSLGEIHGRYQ